MIEALTKYFAKNKTSDVVEGLNSLRESFAAHLPALPFLSFAEKKETKKAADFKNCLKVGCYLDCTSPRLYCRAKNNYCIVLLKNINVSPDATTTAH